MNNYEDNNDYNDLNELKDYLINNYNLDAKINITDGYNNNNNNNNNIKSIYYKVLILSMLLLLFVYIFTNITKRYYKILISIIIISILFCILFYLNRIYCYNKFINNYNFEYYDNIKYKDYLYYKNNNEFNTGDIFQEYTQWYCSFFNIFKYTHNFIILKFNNKNYVLHFVGGITHWPKYVLNIKLKNIEISCLNSYLKNNIYTRYYRVFRNKNIINNSMIFNYLKYITSKEISFSCYNIFNKKYIYQCISFILKFLNYLDIIPKFNFNTFSPDNLYNLSELSNRLYDEPIILFYK
jgi:hypothetical protein